MEILTENKTRSQIPPPQQSELEYRSFTFEVREAGGDGPDKPMMLEGHAAVFNQPVRIYSDLEEEIEPGAFSATLANDQAYMAWNHNPDIILCGTPNGSLQLSEDPTGLKFTATLVNTHEARDKYELVRSGVINKMSFGFIIRKQEWDESDPLVTRRKIKECRLLEVSPVPFPAYDGTSVGARAMAELAQYRSSRVPPADPMPVEDAKDEKLAEQRREIQRRRRMLLAE
jgi:HK97 family phage prohead protease